MYILRKRVHVLVLELLIKNVERTPFKDIFDITLHIILCYLHNVRHYHLTIQTLPLLILYRLSFNVLQCQGHNCITFCFTLKYVIRFIV